MDARLSCFNAYLECGPLLQYFWAAYGGSGLVGKRSVEVWLDEINVPDLSLFLYWQLDCITERCMHELEQAVPDI